MKKVNNHRSIEITTATKPDDLIVALIVVCILRPHTVVVGSTETTWRAVLDHLSSIV